MTLTVYNKKFRLTGRSNSQYIITIPSELTHDSQFPFKPEDEIDIMIYESTWGKGLLFRKARNPSK